MIYYGKILVAFIEKFRWDENSRITGRNVRWNCGIHINRMEHLREVH